eukprot:scaffold19228_cov129-Skeletonema_dohrnii-CCMP3373.AAC.5
MDGASKKRVDDANKKGDAYDDCDFSTISSADSVSSNCLMKHGEPNGTYKDKENHEANKLSATPGKSKNITPMSTRNFPHPLLWCNDTQRWRQRMTNRGYHFTKTLLESEGPSWG